MSECTAAIVLAWWVGLALGWFARAAIARKAAELRAETAAAPAATAAAPGLAAPATPSPPAPQVIVRVDWDLIARCAHAQGYDLVRLPPPAERH